MFFVALLASREPLEAAKNLIYKDMDMAGKGSG